MAGCDGEWHQVRRSKKVARRVIVCQQEHRSPEISVDMKKIQEKLKNAMSELTLEDFWQDWREILTHHLGVQDPYPPQNNTEPPVSEIDCVCYGLGSFLSCVTSHYQLAMLLLLLDALKIPPGRCSVFDPVFSTAERDMLKMFGFSVLTENEEGKRPVSRPTLFYLMHCGTALYNNLLWSNWTPQKLPLLTIVGNSFQGLQDRMVQQDFQRDYTFIADVIGACQETPLPCSPRFLDVFNDTVLLEFPPQCLILLPHHAWTQPCEPKYTNCSDLEIILKDGGC